MTSAAEAMHGVAGRVVIVTGSGRGIGRGIAHHLGKGGARVVVSDLALSGGFGYASVAEGGVGALLAVDLGVITDVTLRLQGSWRRSRFSRDATAPADYQRTVWSLMGGLSLHL